MLSPLDLIKTYLTFKSYFPWFLMAAAIFGIFFFFKNKLSATQTHNTTTWKGYLISFLIILGLLSFIYLCFFKKPKEPSSKYAGQLVNEIDKAIGKYDEIINGYQGLKDNWEQELTKVEAELKELYKAQELTQEQKEKIKELINQTETKINEIKTQKQETENKINVLKEELKQKEETLANKEKKIKLTEKQIEESTDLTEKEKLRTKLDILYDEKIKLVKQITEIKNQIGLFSNDLNALNDHIRITENLKQLLEKQYKDLTEGEQTLFNQIQSVEQRRTEIQNNIDEINEKKTAIDARIEGLRIMQTAADAAKSAADAWDKKHEFSFGNLRDAIFQGAELYMDAFGGRGMLRAVGGGITKKAAGTIAKGGLIVHEAHRAVHLAQQLMQNEDGTPKMMSKETYDIIRKRIEKDLDEAKADYKDAEKKLVEYKDKLHSDQIIKQYEESREVVKKIIQNETSVIREYVTIINELNNKKRKVINEFEKDNARYLQQKQLEIKLEPIDEEIKTIKEELKQKSPNYAKIQERIKQKRYNKFLQPIIN